MRWFKFYRDDLDRPSFSIGIEKFGLDFLFDVICVWSFLCIENGPGVRQIPLSEDVVKVLARKFRIKPADAMARLRYMAESGLVDIVERDGQRILGSAEIERRRDEWSRKAKATETGENPETRRSLSGVSPDTESELQKSEVRGQRSESRANDVTINGPDVTTGRPCSLKSENPWNFSGVDIERVPERFRKGRFVSLFERKFKEFRETLHQEHKDGACHCFVDEFLGEVRDECKRTGIKYPEVLLLRQIETERN